MSRLFRLVLPALMLAMLWLASASGSRAQTVIERLVSPGPLAAAHARLERQCESCHQAFDKTAQNRLCLDCHKPVAADVRGRSGFHGRSREVAGVDCHSCHTDHAGRGARLVRLDPRTFNHFNTDYPLKGAHGRVACASCHLPGVKHRAAATTCAACHAREDPHKGKLGPNCASCHNEAGWKDVRFDHATTGFPLVGGHARAACKGCHADQTFQGASTACAACHARNDVHKGAMGPACGSCHTAAGWTPARFDHGRTGFPLAGAHARAACSDCHVQGRYRGTQPGCVSCHREEDPHKGRYGTACADCHNAGSWRVTRFDHGRTGFALAGGHASLACGACHGPSPARTPAPAPTCVSCHRADDVHKGINGGACDQCHTATSWKGATFDHGRQTGFPLSGAHGRITCAQCHTQPAGTVRLNTACAACHSAKDPHGGQLGADCGGCHNDASWSAGIRFDHGLGAFPLVGKHAAVTCESCHQTRRYRDAPTDCAACHRGKDPHRGAYTADCGGCHNPSGWSNWAFDHGRTGFRLDGRHAQLACATCHRPGRPRRGLSCGDCHQADDPHRGAFGASCGQCHTTISFGGAHPPL